MNIRTIVASYVDKAIDGSINYSGEDKEGNRHIWVQLVTDRIIGSFMGALPEPIDLDSKYETDPEKGLLVQFRDEATVWNDHQLEQLTSYASDRGYNDYRFEVENIIMSPYNLQKQAESAKLNAGENNGTSRI